MKRLALCAAMALATVTAHASTSPTLQSYSTPKTWVLNLGLAFPQGSDARDAGFDLAFMLGVDYVLGDLSGETRGNTYLGAKYIYSTGDDDGTAQGYGVHYGVQFALGKKADTLPLSLKLEAGYYTVKVDNSFNEEKSGLGGGASLVWQPANQRWRLEAGYFWLPTKDNVNANGWFIGVGIPLGG